jgi:hypothetical protein
MDSLNFISFLIIIFFLYLILLLAEYAGAFTQANGLDCLRTGHIIDLHHCDQY